MDASGCGASALGSVPFANDTSVLCVRVGFFFFATEIIHVPWIWENLGYNSAANLCIYL